MPVQRWAAIEAVSKNHGGDAIKEHYRLEGKNLPLPVDYIVAATGG